MIGSEMHIFTSISLNYLPKARILASSIKEFHPDWTFHLLISDNILDEMKRNEEIKLKDEPFDRIIWINELKIANIYGWIFKHSIVEICTAVKGVFLQQLIREGAEKIIYLDPDTAVFNTLDPLDSWLNEYSILLTPHLLEYSEDRQSILDNEIMGVLKHGIFNLGFFAINSNRPYGIRFANWWGDRLTNYCYADYNQGLFTDQKWCDLVPAYFEDYFIIRDPGYNVASWNIDKRHLSMSEDGQIRINEKYPLRFYHFTGYDSGAGASMTKRYDEGNQLINEIWDWYGRTLQEKQQNIFSKYNYFYSFYDNGKRITNDARLIYRQREDLQEAFPNPFKTKDNSGKIKGSFYSWYINNRNTF